MPNNGPSEELLANLSLSSGEDVTIEAADGDGSSLVKFKMLAYTGGLMNPGWGYPVVVDIKGMKIVDKKVPIRLQHDVDRGLGHTETVRKDNYQVRAEGVFSRQNVHSAEIIQSSKDGYPWQSSVGLSVNKHEFIESGKKLRANNQVFEGPVYVVRESVLNEISFVERGADRETSASVAAQLKENQMSDTPKEGDGTKVEADAQTTPETPETVEASNTPSVADTIKAEREERAAEALRVGEINKLAASHPEIAAEAIVQGWDADRVKEKVELADLRASRTNVPNIHATDKELSGSVLEAALAMGTSMATTDLEASYDEKTLEAASKRYGSGIGLQETLLEAAQANGYSGRGIRDNLPRIMRFAFQGQNDLEASWSNTSISGVLSNIANKSLLAGYNSVDQSWRGVAASSPVNDFKTHTRYRMTGDGTFRKVGAGGNIEHGDMSEQSFTNSADTYARMLAITREQIINDDLGALSAVPRKLGRDGAKSFNTIFWDEFVDNASFFTAGRNNLETGGGSALGIAGMQGAVQAFMDQTDPDGDPLGSTPAIVLVPSSLDFEASQLINSAEIRSGESGQYGLHNKYAGQFRQVTSPYLAANSTTAWYLLADPNDLPTIEAVFLYGRDVPMVDQAEADFSTLGIQMRGIFDFGVAKQDYRGGVKNAGA